MTTRSSSRARRRAWRSRSSICRRCCRSSSRYGPSRLSVRGYVLLKAALTAGGVCVAGAVRPRDAAAVQVAGVRQVRGDGVHGSVLGQRGPREEGAVQGDPRRAQRVPRSHPSTDHGNGKRVPFCCNFPSADRASWGCSTRRSGRPSAARRSFCRNRRRSRCPRRTRRSSLHWARSRTACARSWRACARGRRRSRRRWRRSGRTSARRRTS